MVPRLDPAHLPDLATQGLAVEVGDAILLETTAGKVLGELTGFSFNPPENLNGAIFARSVGIQALAAADPSLTVLFDRAGNGWLLDVGARRLVRIARIETPPPAAPRSGSSSPATRTGV